MVADKISWGSLLNMKSCHVMKNFFFSRFVVVSMLMWRFWEHHSLVCRLISIVLRLSPICFLMTLFSFICFSDESFWLLSWRVNEFQSKEFCVSGNHPAQTSDSSWFSITSQLLHPTLCFEIMQNDASLVGVSGWRKFRNKRIKCFSCSCDETGVEESRRIWDH